MFTAFIRSEEISLQSHQVLAKTLVTALTEKNVGAVSIYCAALSSLHRFAGRLGPTTPELARKLFIEELSIAARSTSEFDFGLILVAGSIRAGFAAGESQPMIWLRAPLAKRGMVRRLALEAGLIFEAVLEQVELTRLLGPNTKAKLSALQGVNQFTFSHDIFPFDYLRQSGEWKGVAAQVEGFSRVVVSALGRALVRRQGSPSGSPTVEAYIPYDYATERALESVTLSDYISSPISAIDSFVRISNHSDIRDRLGLRNPDDTPSVVEEKWVQLDCEKKGGLVDLFRWEVRFADAPGDSLSFLVLHSRRSAKHIPAKELR